MSDQGQLEGPIDSIAVASIYMGAGICQYYGGDLADHYPNKMVYLLTFLAQVPLCLLIIAAFGAKLVLSIGVSAAGVPLIAWTYGATGGFAWLFYAMAAMALAATVTCLSLPGVRDEIPVPVAEKAVAAAD